MSTKVIVAGNLRLSDSLKEVHRGFERAGCDIIDYIPTDERQPDGSKDFGNNAREKFEAALPDADVMYWWQPKHAASVELLEELKQINDIPFVMQSVDDPFQLDRGFSRCHEGFDAAVTCARCAFDWYESRGVSPMLGYPPCDEDTHGGATYKVQFDTDISFAAFNTYPPERYPRVLADRAEMVKAVEDLGEVRLYGRWGECSVDWARLGAEYEGMFAGKLDHDTLPDMWRSSAVNLNSHVRPDAYKYLNERTTTCMASGGFMLVDRVSGIEKVLPDGTCDFWETLEELHDKTRYWLSHDRERRRVADAAQEFALEAFSGQRLARRILDHVL